MKKYFLYMLFIVIIIGLAVYAVAQAIQVKYLGQKNAVLETRMASLRAHLKQVEAGNPGELQGDLVLGLTNTSVDKLENAFLPMSFPLKKDFSGEIILESISDIHFLANNTIHFNTVVAGKNIRYEGTRGIFGSIGKTLRDFLTIRSFTASADCLGTMAFKHQLPGIEINFTVEKLSIPNVSPYIEEQILAQLNHELAKKPQQLKFSLKPQNIHIEDEERIVSVTPQGIKTSGTRLFVFGNCTVSGKPGSPAGPAAPAKKVAPRSKSPHRNR